LWLDDDKNRADHLLSAEVIYADEVIGNQLSTHGTSGLSQKCAP